MACSHVDFKGNRDIPRHNLGRTLGDIPRSDAVLSVQKLESVTVGRVITTYSKTLSMFSKPSERRAVLKRMADLTMEGTENKLVAEDDVKDQAEEDLEPIDLEEVTGQQLQIIFATSAAERAKAKKLEHAKEVAAMNKHLNYETASKIYERIIAAAEPEADLSEIYYLLAKAYDLDGNAEQSLAALDTLAATYPKSPHIYEAQFRRGEQLFLLADYEEASNAYQTILTAGLGTPFYEQSLYKHGWAQYKLSDYDFAVHDFVRLMDIYQQRSTTALAQQEPAQVTDTSTLDAATPPQASKNLSIASNDEKSTTSDTPVTETTDSQQGGLSFSFGSSEDEENDTIAAQDTTDPEQGGISLSIGSDDEKGHDTAEASLHVPAETQQDSISISVAANGAAEITSPAAKEKSNEQRSGLTKTQQKVMTDTIRVTALAFSNLEGAQSVSSYFEEYGQRVYEVDIYNTLASLYLYQQRYRDAADTYSEFTTVYPLHPRAPAMASKVIDTFLKGGFPSLVLPYKERFVKNYGLYSQHWKHATPYARAQYADELKQHLTELAHHYHAVAQGNKKTAGYLAAARWYREFLATLPKDKAAPEMNMLLAETLFAAKHFQPAIEEFERTAYEYPANENSSKAGYFALLSYQEFIKSLKRSDPTKRGWIAKRTSSSLQFAKMFPEHEQTPTIVDGIIENQLASNDIKGAITTSEFLIKLIPPAPKKLWEKAWTTIANGKFDLALYTEAEEALTKILGFSSHTDKQLSSLHSRRATAVYKQAEALNKAGKLREAAAGYLRVAMIEPTAKIRSTAEYDAANLLLQLEDWNQAISVLEGFKKRYPRHKLIATLPAKLSLAYEKSGDWEKAARELEIIADKNQWNNPAIAKEALWQAAKLVDQTNNEQEAIRLYKKYVWNFKKPFAIKVEGQFRLTELYAIAGDTKKQHFWLDKLVQSYKNGGTNNTDRTLYLAGFASNELALPIFNKFNRIRLKQPLKRYLRKKKIAMKAATKAYSNVVSYGILEFTTAANFKIGEIYGLFAKSILESERPRGLDEETLEEYELLLEDQALPIEDKAIEIFKANANRTKDGIWDEWVQKSYKSLSILLPGRYAKDEIREESVDAIY
ncbi:MAG: hypothetical protein COA99_10035 [Moraxellaceae bacterium]|nr:MAG: hypothetical protein COA99_10035 [Moraxellaceae bacterium]